MQKTNMVGKKTGMLTAIAPAPSQNGYARWVCRCECGQQTTVRGSDMRSGATVSCGCIASRKTFAERTHHLVTKHGHWKSATYQSWLAMRRRCKDPKRTHYFQKGIKVCARWDSFENFLADMGERPNKAMTLDRIDSNGHYEPSNCRWATKKEQSRTSGRRPWRHLRH